MKHSQNLAGKSKTVLVMLLIWRVLWLVFIVGCTIGGLAAIVAGIIWFAGVPITLVVLGALIVSAPASAERRRLFTIAWW